MINYLRLMRFHQPVGIFLLLWPTLWALWISAGISAEISTHRFPNTWVLFVFIAGVILMRAAGCIINDIADRRFDGSVARTRLRPLVIGDVSLRGAFILLLLLLMLAGILVLTLNKLTVLLSGIAVLVTLIYPFLKRYTHWPQLGLGIGFAWGIPMAFTAEAGYIPWAGWILFLSTVLWVIAYDTQYAMADRSDDLKIGVKSTAILFGQYDRLIILLLQLIMLSLLFLIGHLLVLSLWYYLSLGATLVFIAYQQYLIRDREPDRCLRAFRSNNWVGLLIFLGILL